MKQSVILCFIEYLQQKGYAERTIDFYVRALKQAPDDWDTSDPAVLCEHIKNTLAGNRGNWPPSVNQAIKPASSLFFAMKTGTTITEYEINFLEQPCSELDPILNEFYQYSTGFKSLTESSAKAERKHVETFLSSLGSLPDAWDGITASDIKDYVNKFLCGLRPSTIGRYVTSIRNFFRFLEYKGVVVNSSVLELPLAPAEWKKGSVPITLTAEEEMRLCSHYQKDTPLGNRNHLIIHLMLILGLRCSEVANLKITDIKWNQGTVLIRNTKNGCDRELPITDELGLMLEDYVLHYRPSQEVPALFQRNTFDGETLPMSRESVRTVIRTAFKKEDITGWWKGTHALRRTAASRIYNSGNGLKLTADLLGHMSLDSTSQYVKVDFDSLRKAACPWPGGDNSEN